jgi:SAM-dependent methyltransferase
VPCPLCGGEQRKRLYTEHGAIGIVRCLGCGLLYACPRVKSPEQAYWGDAEAYAEEARLIFEGKATHHRDPNYLEELRLIQRFQPAGRFLDVGCNMGMLLRHVRRMGWEAVGVEPSPSLAKLATERWGLRVYNCFLHELPKEEEGAFDVIALSDVLEHITEPLPFLSDVRRFLADTGVLYVKVPNGRWNLFKQQALGLLGRRPTQGIWDSYEHVVHYTEETLRAMLRRGGFQPCLVTISRPVQVPVWERYVGRYYLYPSPWVLDWPRHVGREAFYGLSLVERGLRGGRIGALAPDIVMLARKLERPHGAAS